MAYDERVARRVRAELGGLPGLVEKKMFGGVGFIVLGNTVVIGHDSFPRSILDACVRGHDD